MTRKDRPLYLFVCTGNTCRSPMARGYFEAEITARGLCFTSDSAGLSVVNPYPAAENAVSVLLEQGIDLSSHRSKRISDELMDRAERVYVMTKGHADLLEMMYPEYKEKIIILSSEDISDPYGGDLTKYRRAAAQIRAAVRKLIEELEGK